MQTIVAAQSKSSPATDHSTVLGIGMLVLGLGLIAARDGAPNDPTRFFYMNKQTQADRVAARLDNDGQCFEAMDGQSFTELCMNFGAMPEYSSRRYVGDGQYIYEPGYRGGYIADDPVRYVFPDGSVLVVAGAGWDHEGTEPFSWRG